MTIQSIICITERSEIMTVLKINTTDSRVFDNIKIINDRPIDALCPADIENICRTHTQIDITMQTDSEISSAVISVSDIRSILMY